MQELTYQVSFNTPAFLGNAEQGGQWRTPPFKALLRQWWRVVRAPEIGYDHRKLLQEENALFGTAGGDEGGGRSRVQMRLSDWSAGGLCQLPRMATHAHNEVKRNGQLVPVGTAVYLGFGPVTLQGVRPAISPDSPPVTLRLRCPEADAPALRKSMQMASWFGTMGSRARNGWGSLHIEGEDIMGWERLCDATLVTQAPLRRFDDVLKDRVAGDWPGAVGACADDRPAVWRVVADRKVNDKGQSYYTGYPEWKGVLEQLAALKVGFRTQFKLGSGAPHPRVEDRHILAYPVTNHALAGLPHGRLASQMRFKVCKNRGGQFFGLIVHLPCTMPQAFFKGGSVRPPDVSQQISVWQQVHDFLNQQPPHVVARIRKGDLA